MTLLEVPVPRSSMKSFVTTITPWGIFIISSFVLKAEAEFVAAYPCPWVVVTSNWDMVTTSAAGAEAPVVVELVWSAACAARRVGAVEIVSADSTPNRTLVFFMVGVLRVAPAVPAGGSEA